MSKPPRKTDAERKVQAEALHESITQQVAALTDSETWMHYLDFMRGFHSYSVRNLLLIFSQAPEATAVAGFRAWQDKGRQVRKGERGIRIFGYSSRKVTDENGDVQLDDEGNPRTRATFPVLSVFDISQTDPIDPDDPEPWQLSNHLAGDDVAGIVGSVARFLEALGWTFTLEPIDGPANGYTTTDGSRRVVVDEGMTAAQQAKTALHEAAHVILHAATPDEANPYRGLRECVAESVAYVVAGMVGLDTSAYSVGYVAGWIDGDTDKMRDTAANVLRAVHQLADAIAPSQPEPA